MPAAQTAMEKKKRSFAMPHVFVILTIIMLLVLDARLSLIVFFFLFLMALYIRHNGKLSKKVLLRAAGAPGKHQRLCGGDGCRTEGRKGV